VRRAVGVVFVPAIAFLVLSHAALAQKPAAAGPKVFISVDMEGVAGVVTVDQLGPAGFEYERFRRFMTDEALAAVRAAKAAGATDIVVADSHGNGESLLIEAFPRDVRIVRSWPRRGGMMGGLDSSFGAAIMIGYHASASSPAGVRAHTISSATFTRVAINGQDMSEGALGAAQAGAMGVPVVFMSGDDVATAELRERIGNIVTVETKKALSFHSAETITPAESTARIEAGVRSALSRLREFKPYTVSTPVTLELSYKNYAAAEVISYLPGVTRVGSRTVRTVTPDIAVAVDFIMVAESYQPDLSP
jgi:D-amino peptidase